MSELPFVSIVVPCRNEERFIGRCLDSILATDYPSHRMEVLVVDGMSDDRTRDIIAGYVNRYACMRLVSNPKRVTPAALNAGIGSANGHIIIRMDAHAEYPTHYVSTCVKYLEDLGVDVVGGPVVTTPGAATLMARSIALATAHPFGVGNSRFRISTKAGYVDTVPFGAYRSGLFKQVGLFDERLVRNQDNELNSRILASGGKIYLTPELAVRYYNQATANGLLRQAWRTGMWNVLALSINPRIFRWRHFAPLAFVTAMLALAALAPWLLGARSAFLFLVGAYGAAAVASAVQIAAREGMKYVWILPLVFLGYHVSYGLGTLTGVMRTAVVGWGGPPDRDPGQGERAAPV